MQRDAPLTGLRPGIFFSFLPSTFLYKCVFDRKTAKVAPAVRIYCLTCPQNTKEFKFRIERLSPRGGGVLSFFKNASGVRPLHVKIPLEWQLEVFAKYFTDSNMPCREFCQILDRIMDRLRK